jgi:hypothetical protein
MKLFMQGRHMAIKEQVASSNSHMNLLLEEIRGLHQGWVEVAQLGGPHIVIIE